MQSECCWTKEVITPDECDSISSDETDLYTSLERRFLAKCIECPLFVRDQERLTEEENPSAPVLRILIAEINRKKSKLNTLVGFLDSRNLEIQSLHEIVAVLQTSLELDEVLSVALTAITAGKGFGMNRAFLLLTDKDRTTLKGYLGVGPLDYQEAWDIWEEISRDDLSLREMATHFHQTKFSAEKNKFHDILERLSFPMNEEGHILVRSLNERRAILVRDALHHPEVDPYLAQTIGADTFLILPLISRNRRIGVILADNLITRKPITQQDISFMETLTFPVAFAIERASLYEHLHEDLEKLSVANIRLQEQQKLIVRMEKLALLGKITSSIAHSIRNPLTVIGGFARSLLKNVAENDPKREPLENIVQKSKQLEDVLSEVLGYADSVLPAIDEWDVNQMVETIALELMKKTEGSGISITLSLAPELPMIYLDYRQIAYCIKKILSNSIKVMIPPGEIYLGTSLLKDCIMVEIRDTVPVLEREAHEAFLDTGLTGIDETCDMELSFCRVILENYAKSFTVERHAGKGSRFLLELSLKKEDSDHE
ncbi:MAG: GAF domain-containing protein [Geobacteraceae bacterium]|nr:GAF domain-containing protein [Geobacteraceae bacterium]